MYDKHVHARRCLLFRDDVSGRQGSCQLSRFNIYFDPQELPLQTPLVFLIIKHPEVMAVAYPLPHASAETLSNIRLLLKFTILAVIAAAAIASRLFAVIRHESIIHEL